MLINSPETHELALLVLEVLEENHAENVIAFDILFKEIYQYEETAPELAEFNSRFV